MIIFIYSKQEIIYLLLNYKLYHIETLLDLLKKLLKKEYRMTLKNYENSL